MRAWKRNLAEWRETRAAWAVTKRFEISKFKFKFPRARTFELCRARSRLHRSQNLKVNIRWKALAEIYTIHIFAQISDLNMSIQVIITIPSKHFQIAFLKLCLFCLIQKAYFLL